MFAFHMVSSFERHVTDEMHRDSLNYVWGEGEMHHGKCSLLALLVGNKVFKVAF